MINKNKEKEEIMKDFDFDEIDQAVNTALNKTNKSGDEPAKNESQVDQNKSNDKPGQVNPPAEMPKGSGEMNKDNQKENISDQDNKEKDISDEQMVKDKVNGDLSQMKGEEMDNESNKDQMKVNPRNNKPIDLDKNNGSKNSARFMDVKVSGQNSANKPISRLGKDIAPDKSADQDKVEKDNKDEKLLNESSPYYLEKSVDDDKVKDQYKKMDSQFDDNSSQDEPPLSTPFISGTPVEKRPLGGEGSKQNNQMDNQPDNAPDNQEKSMDQNQFDKPIEKRDSINVSGDKKENDYQPNDQEVENAEKPQLHEEINKLNSESYEKNNQSNPNAGYQSHHEFAVNPKAIGSIPNQYQVKSNNENKEHTPIYDNEINLKPLEHPKKQNSGWLIVVMIVTIILICVAAVLGLYFVGVI